MLAVAVGWQVYALSGSTLYLGLVGLAQFLPMFLLTLVVGHVADRSDRRKIARTCQLIEGASTGVLAAATLGGWISTEVILIVVVAIGSARAFEGPSMQALMPGLVSAEVFPRATAWSTSATQTAAIVGPALGGALYVAGPIVVYSVSAGLLVGAGFLVTSIKVAATLKERKAATLKSVFAGISFIRNRPVIFGAISLDLFAVLLGGATALLPAYARDILFIGPVGLGVLRAAPSAGAVGMSFLLAQYPLRRRVGRTMFVAVAVFGIGTIAFAVSRSFALSLAALIVLGGADVISMVIRSALVQLKTPDEMRGRVSAVNSLFVGTSNQLGEFESGVTASWFGIVPAVLIGGIGTIIVVILWIRFFPELARADKLDSG
jgi:MFS family permease